MHLIDHPLYQEDVKRAASQNLPWEKLQDKSVLISGATGLIGSFLVDVILYRNAEHSMNCTVYGLSRSRKRAEDRFPDSVSKGFHFVAYDINEPLEQGVPEEADYVLHLASNTHPVAYATDPIGTITTNLIGVKNMLDYAERAGSKRVLFASSNEIYGENRGDVHAFDETYCGYIDCNTLRAGYPESKRCSEALCQAYVKQKEMDVVVARLTRSYGPTLLKTDTKAISQFLHKCVCGEDIVLKSAGDQYYSYTYMADAVTGLLTVLLCGDTGEAYNIADSASDIRLRDLARKIAGIGGRKVVFDLPDDTEKEGFSKATKALLDSSKLRKLGWKAAYDMDEGLERTIQILKAL